MQMINDNEKGALQIYIIIIIIIIVDECLILKLNLKKGILSLGAGL